MHRITGRVVAPTFQQMRLFEAVARHGSITRAAEEVNLTQPSVSMQVRALEEKLGQPLTEQIGKSLQLTPAGEVALAASRDIIDRLAEMTSALEDLSGEVAGRLWGKHGIRSLVVWAGGEERARAREIAAVAGDHAVVSPSTSLPQLAGVLRRTSMLVSADTGPAHLAAAVGTPVVGLFGPTLPEVTGPYGDQHIAIQAFHQSGRAVKRRRTPNTAMLAITVDQVCLACEQVLTRGDAKTCAA